MTWVMSGAVITGIGCVTPIGLGLDSFADALRSGVSGVGPLTLIDSRPYACRVASEVHDFNALDFMPLREARSSPRVVQFAIAAGRMALEQAGLRRLPDPARVGVVVGSSGGPSAYHYEQFAIFVERGVRRMHPSFPAHAHYGAIASECAIQFDAHGPVFSISSACTSSTDAIGIAKTLIEAGVADVILAGGAEAPIFPILFATFDRLQMMPVHFNDTPERASRPFSADREGFVLGEGAVIAVLESREHAAARGANALAEVVGYAATCDAHSHFAQAEAGADAVRAVELALKMSGVHADQIEYVNAHGSSTVQNDAFETAMLRTVLKDRADAIPVSSSKSMFGHLLGASGAAELAATIAGMRGGFVPPTINLQSRDPACDLDYVPNRARDGRYDLALSINFGFGSRNAALVVRSCGDDAAA